jgi:hypothetical protein
MQIDSAFGNWLAGFIDGEGCFTIRHSKRVGSVGCSFILSVRFDDAEIIEEIHRRTDIGRVRVRDRTGGPGLNGKPQVLWAVNSVPDCLRLAALLDEHPLRAKKRRDYAIWRLALAEDAARYIGYGKRRRLPGHEEHVRRMLAYRDAMTATRSYDETPIALPHPRLQLVG